MTKLWQVAAGALAAGLICVGTQAQTPDSIATGDLQWKEMIPGVKFAPAYGDWEKGAHGKYVRIDHGVQVPMHTHSKDYRAVFISGRMANLFEDGVRTEVSSGDYYYMAAKRPHAHQCLAEDGCVFYTYGDDLWDIEVVEAD